MDRPRLLNRVPLIDPDQMYNWQERETSGLIVATSRTRRAEPLRAERFELALPVGTEHAKVLQVVWAKNEIGLYVSSPFLKPRHAIVGIAILRQPLGGTGTLDLRENGKVSRSEVKPSFHRSGQVRISATGKVRSIPLDRTPLANQLGHLFTAHVGGLGAFDLVGTRDRQRRPGRQLVIDLPVPVALGNDSAIKLVGRWYPHARVGLDRVDFDGHTPPGMMMIELTPNVLTT